MGHYDEGYDKTVSSWKAGVNADVERINREASMDEYDEKLYESIKQGLGEAIQQAGTKCDRNKPVNANPVNNPVSSPNHYLKLGYECIEIIACSLSQEAFKGYCMGNFLKYRFRMGNKDAIMQDFDKSKEYLMLYDKYMHLCKDVPF